MSAILQGLRRFDAYPKTLEDFTEKTLGGLIVTIITICIITQLSYYELKDYLSPSVSEELFVDTSRGHKLNINLDIIVPNIACSYLSLDATDTSGEHHIHIEHNIFKRRLDLKGEPIEEPEKEDVRSHSNSTSKGEKDHDKKDEKMDHDKKVGKMDHEKTDPHSSKSTSALPPMNSTEPSTALEEKRKFCGSCYGVPKDYMECCNTCKDVQDAYAFMKWEFDPTKVSQCENYDSLSHENAFKEGCQVYGHLEVNRVAGSFHLAPGRSYSFDHVHVHDIQPYSSKMFNTTHKIQHLSFGLNIPGKTNPIDGLMAVTPDGATMFHYYLKIVPTTFLHQNNTIVQTNQFSVTKHMKVVSGRGDSGMPGIFFSYEISPLMVKYTENTKSIGHTLTNLCSIIGGVVTVARILDSIFYHSNRVIRKIELGKAN